MRERRPTQQCAGQVLVFLLMVLVILFFVVLWNFDVHRTVVIKTLSRNGGDAAALAASRWQGVTLNLIGDLNLLHAVALATDDHEETEQAILGTQARLCFVGPMIALVAAQQAAKNNGIFQNDDFTGWMRRHATEVRSDYPRRADPNDPTSPMLFAEPYPGAWKEYADMIDLVVADGVAAGPDNAHYFADYDFNAHHYLLSKAFYEAVGSKDWCWFYLHARNLLQDYRNFMWWDPLPTIRHPQPINCEYFGLGLVKESARLSDLADASTIADVAADRDISAGYAGSGRFEGAVWYCYGSWAWSDWAAMELDGPDALPLTGAVRPPYKYTGADAVTRVAAKAARLTPGAHGSKITRDITWTAAAKPFGYLEHDERPDKYELVLPAFHEARLFPVDASSAPDGGAFDLDWRKHIEIHLPKYMAHGLSGLDGACWYCQQLRTWENQSFRQEGLDWLMENSELCTRTYTIGGGGSAAGGSMHGH